MSISLNRISLFSLREIRISRTGFSCLPESTVCRAGIRHKALLSYLALHRIRLSRRILSPVYPVVSYTTISPLPSTYFLSFLEAAKKIGAGRFVSVELALRYRSFPLGSIPPSGARTFLSPLKGKQTFILL